MIYVLPLFVPILLSSELSMFEAWKRLQGELVKSDLEVDYGAVMDWLQVALVQSALEALSHLLMSDHTSPLANAVLLKHCHNVSIWDLPGPNSSLSWATCSLTAKNIRDRVTKQRAVCMEAETLWSQKENKGA